MGSTPLVSTIMSAYNAQPFVSEAIQSMLNQTFTDFEFLIINDGSTDGTDAVLAKYEKLDRRIRILSQENKGLISSLNRGCRLARGKYIARMDADDISLPARLEKQVQHLESHPEIGILGTWIGVIDEEGSPLRTWKPPASPAVLMWTLCFRCGLAHPSVMMRRDIVASLGFYRPEALHVEDYDLWARASHVTRLANIREILCLYRHWAGNVCSHHSKWQEKLITEMIMPSVITPLLGRQVSRSTLVALRQLSMDSPLEDSAQTMKVATLITDLHRAFLERKGLSRSEAKSVSRDAGLRLQTLASFATRASFWKGLILYLRAIRLNPRCLSAKRMARILGGLSSGRGGRRSILWGKRP